MKERFYKSNYFRKKEKKDFTLNYNSSFADIPKNALIELSNGCNHACVFCYNPEMTRKTMHLNMDTYKEFIKKAVNEGVIEVGLYSTGEPFMTKNLSDYIEFAKDTGIKRVYITTNGALANLEKFKKCINAGLDSIKFSINAGSKETYKTIHGYDDFEKVINNVKSLYEYKKKYNKDIQIMCSFVYTDLTYKEIDDFKKKYGKYFEDMFFQKSMNQGGRTLKSDILTKAINKDNPVEKKSFKPCAMVWNRLHFSAEGYMTACCVDYENDLLYEKFDKNKKLINQFKKKKITKLKEKHLNNNLDGTICKNCLYNCEEDYERLVDVKTAKMPINKKKNDSLKLRISEVTSSNK